MPASPSALRRRSSFNVVLVALLAAGATACSAPSPPPVEHPAPLSFRPTKHGAAQWLATPFAVELRTEQDARVLESVDATYLGEIGVGGKRIPTQQRALLPMIAADQGATHFRVVSAGEGLRVDIVLYRVERERWWALPETLRPTAPADGVGAPGQSSASL